MKKRYTVCTFTDGVTKVLEEARDHAKTHNGRLTDNEASAYKARLDAAARMDKEVLRKALAKEMSVALERGDIRTAGEILDESWVYKKQFSNKVTNPRIDSMYDAAKKAGAIGGKVSGAGGGGFMYFICEYNRKYNVAQELGKMGAKVADFMFEPQGVISWRYPNE